MDSCYNGLKEEKGEMTVKLIVAVASDWGIGFDGDLYINNNKRAGVIDFLYLSIFIMILIFL